MKILSAELESCTSDLKSGGGGVNAADVIRGNKKVLQNPRSCPLYVVHAQGLIPSFQKYDPQLSVITPSSNEAL